jgi:hypothetical protein
MSQGPNKKQKTNPADKQDHIVMVHMEGGEAYCLCQACIDRRKKRDAVVHMEGEEAYCLCQACRQRRIQIDDTVQFLESSSKHNNYEPGTPMRHYAPATARAATRRSTTVTPEKQHQARNPQVSPLTLMRYGKPTPHGDSLAAEIKRLSLTVPFECASYHQASALDSTSFCAVAPTGNNQSLRSFDENGIHLEGVTNNANQFFSPTIIQSFLQPMIDTGVYNLSHGGIFAIRDGTTHEQRKLDTNGKYAFLFSPIMLKDKKPSLLNAANKYEMIDTPQGRKYNRSFYRDNVETKFMKNPPGQTFSSLEMGGYLHEWQIFQDFVTEHQLGMNFMMSHGPAINQNMLLLSLKQKYVHVFLGNMESDLMEKARLSGFLPVFLIKNAYLQKSAKFGINGYQVSTMDMSPKSYLLLVAFYKGNIENDTLEIITLTNQDKQFMVLPSSRT